MASTRRRNNKGAVDRNRVARAIFAAAESMGIRDRELLEKLTGQVIQRLELSQPLPGMEELVLGGRSSRDEPGVESQIGALVIEMLGKQDGPRDEPPAGAPALEVLSKQDGPQAEAPVLDIEGEVGGGSTEREARVESIKSIELTPNAVRVLERRYLAKDSQGQPAESPEEMFRRVAQNIAAEAVHDPNADLASREEEFYQLMASLDFLPNSPTLMNAGRELQQLSACFVLPIEDSMDSIFDAVKYTALIHKSGGGTGFSFSRLRPAKDKVGSTGGVASGPVSFMRAFDTATDVIKQGGMRRGANMAILNVDHPDIMDFINAKKDTGALTNFNLSVALSARFMEAAERGDDYDLVHPGTGEVRGQLNAKEVFDTIVDMAWGTGDPGIVFLDRINRDNPTPELGAIESTNPCGEQPLLPFESCNLGSINLARMLRAKDGGLEIDHAKLERTIKAAVKFLDNVIDANHFPLPQIAEMSRATRKIGLGVMGFADMLIRLGIAYDSEAALKAAEDIMRFVSEKATEASVGLAGERGVFPAFEGSIYDGGRGPKVRNATRTTIAPTGSLSIIAGCSSGIEPLFALSYVRNVLDDEHLVEVNPCFEEVARREEFYSPELMTYLAQGGQLRSREDVPDWVKGVFVTAHDIAPEWHIRMQTAFQRQTDNAVSKTVNFPHQATREDVARVFMLAYREGAKGVTIYRDRSREQQVLNLGQKAKVEIEVGAEGRTPRARAKTTQGITERVSTGCGNMYVTVNFDDEGICEVFSHLGKGGGCASAQLEAICRLISLALRSGVETASVIKHLRGIRCPAVAWEKGHAVVSCADAIGSVLERQLNGETAAPKAVDFGPNFGGQCPECGNLLVYQEGCHLCPSCGYTRCS